MGLLESFDFSARPDALILILGSMPGEESLRQQEYYAYPRNAFWDIMGELFGASRALPYPERLLRLQQHHIALWDVIKHCAREGSLDSNIKHHSVIPNDFQSLFQHCPQIHTVFFNGKKAAELFQKLVLPGLAESDQQKRFITLPSTSPANASLSTRQKLEQWRLIIESLEG